MTVLATQRTCSTGRSLGQSNIHTRVRAGTGTHLADTEVRARRVHVRVVRQKDVQSRARFVCDSGARIALDDDLRDVAVLADDAQTENLRNSGGSV